MLAKSSRSYRPLPALVMTPDLQARLAILSGAAKYDASCASCGSTRSGKGPGATHISGICHSWAADGRCISLLKVLLSNACRYDCAYCANRRSNDHRRVSFSAEELAGLTMEFYRRNYIEGLFLSSAVFSDPDTTMLELLRTLKILRHQYRFHGYIHLKVIPGCSRELVHAGTLLADRLSANIELPSKKSLQLLAPEKEQRQILEVFHQAQGSYLEHHSRPPKAKNNPPGIGMSTQMIIGATPEDDRTILRQVGELYRLPQLQRVYYSAYIPVNSDTRLPVIGNSPPLKREHRLYQADWLLRYYQFDVDEILAPQQLYLDAELDPKAAWALRHLEHFPINVNRASKEELLRVPGLGVRSCAKILRARRQTSLHLDDLKKLGVVMKRARYFLHDGHSMPVAFRSEEALRCALVPQAERQLSLNFNSPAMTTDTSALSGEL